MSWLRDAWDFATYRTPAQNPTLWRWGVPGADFSGATISAVFGPTVATRYPAEVKALGLLAAQESPREFLAVIAERDQPKVRRDGHAAVAATW